jgi:hypothetical protein
MFVGMLGLLMAAGCMQRHVLRMSSPERSSTVTLLDQGDDPGTDDDRVTVLDEPAQIARVAEFLQARAEKWRPFTGKVNRPRRYQITLRKDDEVTDRFWITRDSLFLHTPSGDYYSCDLTDAERAELIGLFAQVNAQVNARVNADAPRGTRG